MELLRTQKGFSAILIFVILAVLIIVGALGYYVYTSQSNSRLVEKEAEQSETINTSRGTASVSPPNMPNEQTPAEKFLTTIELGRYKITLPAGWQATTPRSQNMSYESDLKVLYCEDLVGTEQTGQLCYFSDIQKMDSPKVSLTIATGQMTGGGGGYVTVFSEDLNLGPDKFKGDFTIAYQGDPYTPTEKLNNYIHFINGCLKKDLCLNWDNLGDIGENESEKFLEEFKTFVNSLKIETVN